MSPLFRPDTSTQPSTLGGPFLQAWGPLGSSEGPPVSGSLPIEMWLKKIWLLGADLLRPSSKLRPSLGSLCVRREGVSFCSPRDTPEENTRCRAPAEPELRRLSQGNRFWHTTRRPRGPARRTRRSPHPKGPCGAGRRRAVPPRSASSRQRVWPRRPHWPRAPQPVIGPRSLFYIDRSGPIGAWRLLNMHASRQSASAGAGPPRAVAKLGLLNCYYRGGPIGTELRICQHSRPGPRRSASSHWPRPGPAPAPGAGAPVPIGCVGRRSPLCVNLRA